jgi:nucleoside 2-deoxyribosyltransferase
VSRPRVYLAGPDVFFKDAREHAALLKALCASYGLDGVFPLDVEIKPSSSKKETARRIFEANVELIQSSQAVLANMTPFRGPSADVGTAWEMGYAKALGLLVAAYTADLRSYETRVPPDEFMVESFGLPDNLMLVYGAAVYPTPKEALQALSEAL